MPFTWSKPYTIRKLMENCHDEHQPWPPSTNAVYLVSQKAWRKEPSIRCRPLYLGGCTGQSERLCTRIGDLIADTFGFFDGGTGHHSGGQSLYEWCKRKKVHPWSLHIAWATCDPWCPRCAEIELALLFTSTWADRNEDLQNKNRPPSCHAHGKRIP